jgi:hypothetical protein
MTAEEKPPEESISDPAGSPKVGVESNANSDSGNIDSPRSILPDSTDPSGTESDLPTAHPNMAEAIVGDVEVVEAEIVAQQIGQDDALNATVVPTSKPGSPFAPGGYSLAPPIARNMENIAAHGGAVGAVVLGAWSLFGSFITNWSIINGILGILLGLWGLTSGRRRLALIGIVLSAISIFLCLAQVSEIIGDYLNRPKDAGY